jgi:N-acetylmuramoyl-L-alanine amidase
MEMRYMDTAIFRHIFSKLSCLLLGFGASLLLSSCANFGGGYGSGAGHFNTVIIDAGHGGYDQGARAVSGSPEKVLALDTAQRVARILRSQGFTVIETRRGDYFVPLDTRAGISNKQSGAVFVSIHYNWAPRRAPHGIETYYYTMRSKRLAANILRDVRKAYPTVTRGVKYNNYRVLRCNKRPAVLCELGFVSSPSDNRFDQDPHYRQRIAECIAAGIIAEQRGRNP